MHPRHRPEPELGRIDDLDPERPDRPVEEPLIAGERRAPRRPPPPGRGARWPLLLTGMVLVAAALVWSQREALREGFPASQTRELLNAAARAEAEGRWQGEAGGNDALALYQRVLADDPDNDAARLGLRRVGQALVGQAQDALATADPARARALVALLPDTGEAGATVADLERRIAAIEAAGQALPALLERGQEALARRRIRGDQGALVAFRQMLAIDPGNAVASRGIEDALAVLADEAGQALGAGRLDSAGGMIEAIAAEQPQHASLPALRQRLAQAQAGQQAAAEAQARAAQLAAAEQAAATAAAAAEAVEREVAELARAREQQAEEQARRDAELRRRLASADRALQAGRLEDAITGYQRVLALDGDDPRGQAGLERAAERALAQALSAIEQRNPARAEAGLALARRAGADAAALADAEASLAAMNERLAEVLARPELDAAARARLNRLMEQARGAERRGALVEPAGASAYDLYRQVLAIDPMDEDARRAVAALPSRAQSLVVHHAEMGRLVEAGDALDALVAMAPMDPAIPELRRQLANAWLERGSGQARAGETGPARLSLERARSLAPGHPGLAVLAREIDGG
ncbi:MAG: hypothetical protein KF823_08540 [Xanthomonadales bacterium]|nr:hypothetical protein [Xanthomonadales bacterium]